MRWSSSSSCANTQSIVLFVTLFIAVACQSGSNRRLEGRWQQTNLNTSDAWDWEHLDNEDENPSMKPGTIHNLCDLIMDTESCRFIDIDDKVISLLDEHQQQLVSDTFAILANSKVKDSFTITSSQKRRRENTIWEHYTDGYSVEVIVEFGADGETLYVDGQGVRLQFRRYPD